MIRSIIFDMDGTLADTSPGIFASYRHLAKTIGKEIPSDEKLKSLLGGSLPLNISKLYDINENEIQNCVDIYRKYYADHGCDMAKPYAGLNETLNSLKSRHICLSVATMKAESFAKKMVNNWGVANNFSFVFGVDQNDTITKTDMVRKIIKLTKIPIKETIMIGDTIQDCQTAIDCDIDFIAATYGFQLTTEYCKNNNYRFIDDIRKLVDVIK